MAEFTKLSEVAQIESVSDNATVLVEENGEIVRVPKTSVGGAGGYVAVLTVEDLQNPAAEWYDGPVISENYDKMYDVLCAGGSAWIDYTNMMKNMPSPTAAVGGVWPTNYGSYRAMITDWMMTDIGLIAISTNEGDRTRVLFPNGSHNLPPMAQEN